MLCTNKDLQTKLVPNFKTVLNNLYFRMVLALLVQTLGNRLTMSLIEECRSNKTQFVVLKRNLNLMREKLVWDMLICFKIERFKLKAFLFWLVILGGIGNYL